MEQTLAEPELIAAELRRRQGIDPTASARADIERDLAAIAAERGKIAHNLATVSLTGKMAALIQARVDELEAQATRLERERAEVAGRHDAWARRARQLQNLAPWAARVTARVATRLGDAPYDKRRLALDALGIEARVWGPPHAALPDHDAFRPRRRRVGESEHVHE
jgi:hypothetical protein